MGFFNLIYFFKVNSPAADMGLELKSPVFHPRSQPGDPGWSFYTEIFHHTWAWVWQRLQVLWRVPEVCMGVPASSSEEGRHLPVICSTAAVWGSASGPRG